MGVSLRPNDLEKSSRHKPSLLYDYGSRQSEWARYK